MRAMSMDGLTDRPQSGDQGENLRSVDVSGAARKLARRSRLPRPLRLQATQARAAHRKQDESLSVILNELRPALTDICRSVYDRGTRKQWHEAEFAARLQIEGQMGRVTRLVADLLELSRMESGQLRLERERLDLRAVVQRAIATVESTVRSRQQHLVAWLPDEPIFLRGDRGRLERVFVNLLLNAARYTGHGGNLRVFGQHEHNQAIIRVRDSGVGIAPELLPRIFDLFMRVERLACPGESSLGMGLTLARSFVELHGGNLHAASDGPGLGSEFTVRLPIA